MSQHSQPSFSSDEDDEQITTQQQENCVKPHRLPSEELITDEVKLRIEVIQSLIEPCDRKTYSIKKKEAAQKLGVSPRQIERLLKKYREQRLVALTRTRSDTGKLRIEKEWIDFIIDNYKKGNKASKRMLRHQVFLKVKGRAKELGLKKHPSHQTVYRILDQHIQEEQRKGKARSSGYLGSRLTHMTRDGRELEVEGSNDVWQCDHTRLDIRIVDEYGVLDRPWLTVIIDSYSRCVMGFFLGFYAPSSQIDALALRHAILLKSYGSEYGLGDKEFGTYGICNYFYTDGGNDFQSIHITEQVAVQLGFSCALRRRPSDGGIVERFFRTLNDQLLRTLPGYTGSNVQERPKDVDKDACLTLKDLEIILVRYIVKEYNAHTDARSGDQSRFERWDAGLMIEPTLYDELDLAIALMKAARRVVQKYGCIQFEGWTYRAEHLKGWEGKTVALRYDPDDITTILVYQLHEDGTEEFLDYAHAPGFEAQKLSLREHKAIRKKLREAAEEINNETILAMIEREELVEETVKRNRQQRRQAAHEEVNPVQSVAEKFAVPQPEEVDLGFEDESELELPIYEVHYMDELFEDD
jgi:putative transposase